ncbi:MAG TPA: T9SS type A sorting domain-containing protein, partial [Ignavibacteriaceae bacterium]|nr:T9SS type A sorting domain-containing protein [Ignavibacteriaceae bacterium]
FNPISTIEFYIPQIIHVNLKVFDLLGNEVAELINKEKSAGRHKIDFDASGLSSGIYFYQLKAGNYIQTRKMMVIK